LESAYPNKNSTATRREYDVNDYLRSFAYALCQPTFLYVFGLYDGQFKERGDAYHVGCLPMIYLRQVVERTTRYQSRGCIELPDAGVGTGNYQDRYCIQFTVRKSDRRGGDFSYSMCIRRGGTLNVTDFFRDIEYGLRIASGTEPLPSLDWLSGPRQNASVNEAGLVAYPESSKGAML
jgi:hypothetical protein